MPVSLKRVAQNLLALGVGLLLTLGVAEIALMVLMPPPAVYREPQPSFDYDSRLGWKLRPRQRSFTLAEPVTTNALGLRSPEVDGPPAAGELRILCLGDSQTFGNGVGQEKTYPRRLEALLEARRPGERFTVVNAGVPGYDTLQEVDQLERLLPRLRPTRVVVGFYLNDISEAAYPDKSQVMDEEKGSFRRRGATALLSEETIHVLKRSRLVTFVYYQLRQLLSRGETDAFILPLEGKTSALLEQGWGNIEIALRRAKSLVEAQGGRLVVFPIPAPQEFVGKDYPDEKYRSRLLSLAAELGVTAFDPTPELMADGRDYARHFLAWDGHMNEATHQRVAERLAQITELAQPSHASAP